MISSVLRCLAVAGAVLLSLGTFKCAQAASFTVTNTNNTGAGSLRQAILDANQASTDDTIVFNIPLGSTINLGVGDVVITNNGALTLNNPSLYAPLTLRGDNANRIFNIYHGAKVTVTGFIFRNGSNSASGGDGGAIYNAGTLTLTQCQFYNNQVVPGGNGGTIYNYSGTLTINDCAFNASSAPRLVGGGIATGGSGGFICNANTGRVMVNAASFSGGRAAYGAVFANAENSTLTLNDCLFGDNNASLGYFTNDGFGGVIANSGTVTINRCGAHANSAGQGGVLYNSGGAFATITNSTFYSNQATTNGGAISSATGNTTIDSSTFTANSCQLGGAIFIGTDGFLNLKNSIVAANSSSGGHGPNIYGPVTVGDYNLVDDTEGTTLVGSHNIVGQNPKLGRLANNGGPTYSYTYTPANFVPLAGSPAIDAGNSTLTTDLRGSMRPVDVPEVANAAGGNGSDIGAVEANEEPQSGPNLVVNSTQDHNDGVCGLTDCTLRDAMNVANSFAAATITFDPQVFAAKTTLDLTEPLPEIFSGSNITVSGPTASGAGVTLRDTSVGRIIAVAGGTLNVANLTFAGFGDGIDIYLSGAANVNSCTFSSCLTAIENGNGLNAPSTLTVNNSTFARSGVAAISNGANRASGSVATINSCTFNGNAKGIDLENGTVILSNSLVADNGTNVLTVNGTLTDNGHNILTGTTAAVGLDPGGLKDNGGPTPTIALVAGSPAIDAGAPTLATDQRGHKRPYDFGSVTNESDSNGSDIGAFELNEASQNGPNFVVNKTDDHDDSVCGVTDCTLREAIGAANDNHDASAITFDANVFATPQIILVPTGDLPKITCDLSVVGPTAIGAGVSIENSALNQGTVLRVDNCKANIAFLTLRNASTAVGTMPEGQTTVRNCTVTGTMYGVATAQDGQTTVQNCTFTGNSTGISNNIGANTTVESCTITGNTEGILNAGNASLNLSNSIVVGNGSDDIDQYGTLHDLGHNLIGVSPQAAGVDGNQLRNNGGPTATIALMPGSLAIDAGATTLAADQRGVARDSKPDIGAYEFVSYAPHVVSVSPQGATDRVGAKRTFTLTMSDGNGAGDIKEMWLRINTSIDGSDGATLIYSTNATSPTEGLLYLQRGNDVLPPLKIGTGASATAVSDNGAVRVVGSDVHVSVTGNAVTLTLPLTIRDGLVGTNTLFARAQDASKLVDPAAQIGDQGFVPFGAYTVTPQFSGPTNYAPTLSALTPKVTNSTLNSAGIAGAAQTIGFFAKDDNGTGDIEEIWFLAGKQRGWKNSATFVFYPRTRRLVLRSDDGLQWLGGGQVGTTGIIENSQVRVDLSKAKVLIYSDGKSLGLSLPLQAKNGLLGTNNIWLRTMDSRGATAPNGDNQGYVQSGTWNVKANVSPKGASLSGGAS